MFTANLAVAREPISSLVFYSAHFAFVSKVVIADV